MPARVSAIYISPAATVLPHAVKEVHACAHLGLVGDRYFEGSGTFTDWEPKGPGRDLTLIEGEVPAEIGLSAAEARRNLVTEGVRLNDLVGKRFRIGDVLIEGIRLCPPCTHLDKVTGQSRTIRRRYFNYPPGRSIRIISAPCMPAPNSLWPKHRAANSCVANWRPKAAH